MIVLQNSRKTALPGVIAGPLPHQSLSSLPADDNVPGAYARRHIAVPIFSHVLLIYASHSKRAFRFRSGTGLLVRDLQKVANPCGIP
jgi:hypothetical protein